MKKVMYMVGAIIILSLILIVASIFLKSNSKEAKDSGEVNKMNSQSKTEFNVVEDNKLKQNLRDYIQNEPKLKGALMGISIRESNTGEILFDNMGDIRLRPASNMKILTATAALSVLGENFTFPTMVQTDGKQRDDKLEGNLYLAGKGDPTLLPADYDYFAQELKAQGIETIEGDIIADDTWFDDVRLSPDMIWSDEHFYYGSQVSALTVSPNEDYDTGTVIVEIIPTKEGERPFVTVSPETAYIIIENTAITGAKNDEEDLKVEREHGGNTITIQGVIPVDSANQREWMAVWEPTNYALDLFQQALKKYEISWKGTVKTGQSPKQTTVLITHESMPLSELLIPFMKLSNNGIGEILVKEMGKRVRGEGSWEKGIEVLEEELQKLGVNIDTILIRDGSGISHVSSIPPNELSNLLFTIQNKEWFPEFLNSMPVAGKEDRMIGGTLRNRMHDHSVQAKTGTINGVSTLSGFLETNNGNKLVFSIMVNNLLDEDDGKLIEDKIIEIIVNDR
ncbi:D-alanyl-D-alanine carboxypeptidase/D-alanyl-D-alanine-endopeptidase [Virgibacillus sp. C22-A2]|uniref:D-alanyl-D-alanine carboxypeptidase/D-alanyl-D-alanine-endopeptidase n=1 Tax=Virgibacillus tibetensis TaxID=3042313 RepID=A0ABU6KIQ2_9BACI|nr:D-alanyl-D-alanine carboxypeptidase/D-alanyl-D-alanine-endopeptidase [Virgibacillus sp. C22-A2]